MKAVRIANKLHESYESVSAVEEYDCDAAILPLLELDDSGDAKMMMVHDVVKSTCTVVLSPFSHRDDEGALSRPTMGDAVQSVLSEGYDTDWTFTRLDILDEYRLETDAVPPRANPCAALMGSIRNILGR